MNPNNYFPPVLPQYPSAIPYQSIIAPQQAIVPQILSQPYVSYSNHNHLASIVSLTGANNDVFPQNWRQNGSQSHFQSFVPGLQQQGIYHHPEAIQPILPPASQLVQLSLPPSVKQPKAVIINNQQYLEFLSSDPNQQPQYIPLQFFLQPQNYIQAETTGQQQSFFSSGTMVPAINNVSQNIASSSQSCMDVDNTPPKKLRKSPPKKTQKTLHSFFGNQGSSNQDNDDDLEVVMAKINPNVTQEVEIIGSRKSTHTLNANVFMRDGLEIIDTPNVSSTSKTPNRRKQKSSRSNIASRHQPINNENATLSSSISSGNNVPNSHQHQGTMIPPVNAQAISTGTISVPQDSAASSSSAQPCLSQTPSHTQPSTTKASTPQVKPVQAKTTTISSQSCPSTAGTSSVSTSGLSVRNDSTSVNRTNNLSDVPPILQREDSSKNEKSAKAGGQSKIKPSMNKISLNRSFPALYKRLRTKCALNDTPKIIPLLDFEIISEITSEIIPLLLEVCPNADVKAIGPGSHECGSFFNVAVDDETGVPKYVWFFFTLSVLTQKQGQPQPSEEQLKEWVEEIHRKVVGANVVLDAEICRQKKLYKIRMTHSNANAKLTLVFNSSPAVMRSQLIKCYRKSDPRLMSLAYLYNNLILNSTALHQITNTPLCYLLIYFLQQNKYVNVIHEDKELLEQLDFLEVKDFDDAKKARVLNPDLSAEAIAVLVYKFAKFYSTFQFANVVIDISQKAVYQPSEDLFKKQSPISMMCCFTKKNLASSIGTACLAEFKKKMKEIVQSFENGTEIQMFTSHLDDYARQPVSDKDA